jgi:Glycosyltransferase like family
MISFLVCSIREDQLAGLRENLAASVGVEHEVLVHDNRETRWGLARAYNRLAEQARFPLLCFVHEDVRFRSPPAWGVELVGFHAAHPEAGVVGFAGSMVKTRAASGWGSLPAYSRQNLVQHHPSGGQRTIQANPGGEAFSRVTVLDGFCQFVSRSTWETHRFDEVTFPGFHLYDLDFSIRVALDRSNFVCHTVLAEHFSLGSFSDAWLEATEAFHRKWDAKLPISCVPLEPGQVERCEAYNAYRWLRDLLKRAGTSPGRLEQAWAAYRVHARPGYDLRLVRFRLGAAWRRVRARGS